MTAYNVIGLMSGTSLDGLDIAYCSFWKKDGKWNFDLLKATTVSYSEEWKRKLTDLPGMEAFEFYKTHVEYGHFTGKLVRDFIRENEIRADFISSHGHTIFHRPELMITCQIGDGAAIAAECSLPVINDFRSMDLALGGQGAPLVPVGDALLFPDHDYCLNLGGIANVSFEKENKRVAFDICPVNQVLNRLANQLGREYDDKGKLAETGILNEELLKELDRLDFYSLSSPKSLGREWIEKHFWPVTERSSLPVADKLRTITEHAARQISLSIEDNREKKVLVTGGGAFNDFLIERIKSLTTAQIELPSAAVISFKEAIIFGFLGVLRAEKANNCLASVTGALHDSCSGAWHLA